VGTEALISQSFQLQVKEPKQAYADVTNQEAVQNPVRIDQCVCTVRAVEVPVFACVSNRSSEVSEVGKTLKFCDVHSHEFHARLWVFCDCVLLYLLWNFKR
jgi:hypothetical protein